MSRCGGRTWASSLGPPQLVAGGGGKVSPNRFREDCIVIVVFVVVVGEILLLEGTQPEVIRAIVLEGRPLRRRGGTYSTMRLPSFLPCCCCCCCCC